MEFKDLPTPLQEMASNIVRSQLATLDLSTAEKETIDNMVRNVRNAFLGYMVLIIKSRKAMLING